MIWINNNIYLAPGSEEESRNECPMRMDDARFILAIETESHFRPMAMQQIDAFCTTMSTLHEDAASQNKPIVICSGSKNATAVTDACLLVGSYLILNKGMTSAEVGEAFQELSDKFIPFTAVSTTGDQHIVTVHDCWQALDQAMRLGWFVLPSSTAEPLLDVDEHAHYASAANGAVHLVIPGALIFLPTPADDLVSDGPEWADSEAADGRTARRFSPGFYASLLADLGVSAVACLGSGSPSTARALHARGIAAMDLALEAAPAASGGDELAAIVVALDRLLALAAAAPGAVAVHSGAGAEWPAAVGTLAAAFLIRRFGFAGAAAVAWLHMLAPWMLH